MSDHAAPAGPRPAVPLAHHVTGAQRSGRRGGPTRQFVELVRSAVLEGDHEKLLDGGATTAAALVDAADGEPAIRAQALTLARGLRRPEAREELCALAVEGNSITAMSVVRTAGFGPSDPTRRVLLAFLTDDHERYTELDPDGSVLAAAHVVADERLRRRLADRARASGRPDWVRAVALRRAARSEPLGDAEWGALISVLSRSAHHEQMWRLALEAPPVWSVAVLRRLAAVSWSPADPEDQRLYTELGGLVARCVGRPRHDRWSPNHRTRSAPDPLVEMVTVPVGHLDLAEVRAPYPPRTRVDEPWAALVARLVERHHRYDVDIEVETGGARASRPAADDVELDQGVSASGSGEGPSTGSS